MRKQTVLRTSSELALGMEKGAALTWLIHRRQQHSIAMNKGVHLRSLCSGEDKATCSGQPLFKL